MTTREEMKSLGEEIVRSYEDRIAGIAQLKQTVKMDLKEFGDSRAAMGRELRADLAKSVADLKTAVGTELKELDAARTAMGRELKADLAKSVTDLKQDAGSMLKRFNQSHAAMSKGMRADLAKGRANLVRDERRRSAEVSAWMKEVATAYAGARREWQNLTTTMRAMRAGSAVAVAPSPLVEGAAKLPSKLTDLRHRVFEYLANHPDGTRLVELEQKFGVSRIQMARVLRNLMNQNKVEKRDLLYSAI